MRKPVTALAVAALVTAVAAAPAAASGPTAKESGSSSSSHRAVGLVGGTQLVTFSTRDPRRSGPIGTVTGLQQDTRLVGIDVRVQDGKLYGVGDRGGIYTLDTRTAKATYVQRLTVALQGTSFGVDFNPAANALRVVSDTGQNLRQPFATAGAATVADTPLSTPPAAGTTAGVTGAAYTNNDLDAATATTLFVLSTATDAVAVQSPANAGTLAATGSLGVDATGPAGFDISSTLVKGKSVDVAGYASLSVGGGRGLYEVSLLTGQAKRVGAFAQDVTDIALPLQR
ncbi:DUF4394 domain-containing protein [Kineococcus rubinsiae]|uniref:DUF4394 domain-containing protein n=1 Tax=Kineococcus rubinsiae TaxID=2609562 RepID=UPI0014311B30|nr:DUF4394 domain-containing protein [Kineococcus rubinsiae]NIZ90729.1 DUF4394 domain-containing protein [Kineococcus rubinsiae]